MQDLVGRYVPGYGNIKADLLICGEAPGYNEAEAEEPFVGTTGKMLAETTYEAGIPFNDTYRTNVYKWYPGGGIHLQKQAGYLKSITGHQLEEGYEQLQQEVDTVNPKCILAVGDLALSFFTGKHGIQTWRGSILPSKYDNRKVIGTIHPAALFKTKGDGEKGVIPWRTWYIIKQDIYRACDDSKFRELRIPVRQRRICRGSEDLRIFLERHFQGQGKVKKDSQGRILASVDIESSHNVPITIAIAFNGEEAMSVALFNVGSWKDSSSSITKTERVRIWRLLSDFFSNPNIAFIGQNFKYDHEKIENTLGFRIGKGRLHADVGLMSHVVQPEFRIALEFLTSIYTREPYYKDEGKEFDISKNPLEQLMYYNCTDALVTYEIYERMCEDLKELNLESFYWDYKNKLHDFYMEMERKGMRVNEAVRTRLFDKYVDMHNADLEEMKRETGYYINCNSVPDVRWLLFNKLGLPEREDTGDETLGLLYANHAKNDAQKVGIRNTLRMRQSRKTLSTYVSFMPDFDGRLRSTWRIAGTETDRSATHMLEAPVRPEFNTKPVRGPRKKKKIGLMLHNVTKHGDIGGDVGEMWEPDEGECFGRADLSQAEARIVALLADDKELLKLFDTVDIHSLTASWLFGLKYERIDKKGPHRQTAKAVRHAGNYGMGKRKLTELLAKASMKYRMDLNMSEWRAGELLLKFHAFTPRIVSVFHATVEYCLKSENRTLVNPFGRRRTFHERWGDAMFREAYADIPQSTVPEQLKMAGLRIKERAPDIQFFNEAHDAFDWASKIEDFDRHARIVKEELEKPIDFTNCSIPRGILVIPAEVQQSTTNWKEFKAYKFKEAA
jgi:uracil-DNA glycosylase family 4